VTSTPAPLVLIVGPVIAPLVGIGIARLITVPTFALAILLGVFGGFFLYIGASELLPRSHDRRPRLSTIAATGPGFAFIYLVILLGRR
jgi:ZIP family zinc transporter